MAEDAAESILRLAIAMCRVARQVTRSRSRRRSGRILGAQRARRALPSPAKVAKRPMRSEAERPLFLFFFCISLPETLYTLDSVLFYSSFFPIPFLLSLFLLALSSLSKTLYTLDSVLFYSSFFPIPFLLSLFLSFSSWLDIACPTPLLPPFLYSLSTPPFYFLHPPFSHPLLF